jgi:hypothetical protein
MISDHAGGEKAGAAGQVDRSFWFVRLEPARPHPWRVMGKYGRAVSDPSASSANRLQSYGLRTVMRRDARGNAAPRLNGDAERGAVREVFVCSDTINGIFSSSSRCPVIAAISPRPCVAMKL